jgi:hypothetical protein
MEPRPYIKIKDTRICSFDVENMYTNILKIDTTDIITNILQINSDMNESIQHEIMNILTTVME